MELLDPRGLWLLCGLAPLVVLYILKIRRDRLRVPSTWLWAAAQRDLLAKHPWKRLVAELPLILQALALVALALALARPATRGGRIAGDHVAIVVDTSASMGARSTGDRTRLDDAKQAADAVARALAPNADALVIEAARDARVVSPPERDARRLRAAIDALAVREVEGDLASAVALAADRLRSLGGARRIVIVTDGALAHDAPLASPGIASEVVLVGDPSRANDNAAIVRVDARAGVDPATKREQTQVFAMVQSFAAAPRDAYVTLTLDGRAEPVASRRVRIAPNEKTPVVLTFAPTKEEQGAAFVVEITPHDSLPIDDRAYGRVPGGLRMPVTLATDAAHSWFARALDADPNVDLQRLTLAELATVNVDPDALVVVEGACPADVPGRDVVIVAPPEGACMGVGIGKTIEQPQLTSWESGDPRMRFLTLDGVHVAKARALQAEGLAGSLARAGKSTLIADGSTPGRSATVLGFDVGESDWPLKASFVLFVRNLVEVARLHRAQGTTGPVKTGDPLRIAVPPKVTRLWVEGPGMPEHEIAAHDGFAIVPAIERAGIYRARWLEPHVESSLIAANLTSPRESDLRPRPVSLDPAGGAAPEAAHAPEAHHEWRAWLALLAAIALAFDLWWLTRTPPKRVFEGRAWRITRVSLVALGAAALAYEALVRAGIAHETFVRFETPIALVAPALAGGFLAWRLAKLPQRMGRARRSLLVAFSSIALLGAALAIAEPELGRPLDRMTVLLAIDRSRSIEMVTGADARARAEVAVAERGMHDDDRIGTIVFGAEAATEDPARPKSDLPPPQRIEVGRDGTDLEAAIRRALAELPSDTSGRIALISDGVQTRGDALAGAAAAVAANVPIDFILLEQRQFADVRVVSVRAPPRADEGEAFDLRVVTSSGNAADIEVRVKRDGEMLHATRAHIDAGEDVLHVRELASAAGLHRYDVEVSALDPNADSSPDDNAGSAFVRVRGSALALVLEGDAGKSKPIANALRASAFVVDERSTTGVPADVGGLAGFDLVVLSDVRASDLAPSQLDALASYTRDLGGGLLLMGGDRSMGPGGYARTPIEEVSPVSFDLKKENRRASLAEVIAIDYSGSMGMIVGGQTKLALANEAAARSASLLGNGDRLGVEHVDTVVKWTVPLGPVNDTNAIGATIRSVTVGGGGIWTDVALRAAYGALAKETVNLKHLLLFADGDDAEQIAGCRSIVKNAANGGITTSVISLGRGHDTPELEALSKVGSGRFYLIDDATKLPAVFTQETILAAKSAIHEEPFRVGLGSPAPPTRAIDFASAPELKGYVVTQAKPRATVALAGPEGDPVLATWPVGIGRAGAFTSDFKDRWGSAWLAWPGGAQMFGQLARDLARKADDPRVRLESDTQGGELHVRADVVGDDGRAQTFRRLVVHVSGPDGFARDLPLEAVGAGRYGAQVALTRPGTYVATATDETTGDAVGTTGAVLTMGEELRPTGSDRVLLSRIASMTGGKMRDTLAGVYDDRAARRFAYAPLASLLVALAALATLLNVAARRVAVPDAIARWAARLRALRVTNTQTTHAHDERAARLEQIQAALKAKRPRASPVDARALASSNAMRTVPTATAPSPPAPSIARPAAQATTAQPPAQSPPTERPLTAAERLAEKRRGRR